MSFTLAHLTDLHIGPLPRARLAELFSKRLTGFINWHLLGRSRIHVPAVLKAVIADIGEQRPDHVAVTGDLINIGLAAEYPLARRWLETLGAAADVSLVPGNHDVYVRRTARDHEVAWADYMAGDAEPAPAQSEDAAAETEGEPVAAVRFPSLRRRGPVALIGLSSAQPTAPFMATGRVGSAQLEALARRLDGARADGLFRIVMVHHPLVSPAEAHRKRLTDSAALLAVLKAHGAEMVLHGHDHRDGSMLVDGPAGPIPVISAPSASAINDGSHDAAAYNLFTIEPTGAGWHCTHRLRGLVTATAEAPLVLHEIRRSEWLLPRS